MNGRTLIFFSLFVLLLTAFILTLVLDISPQVKEYGWYSLGLSALFLGAVAIDIIITPSDVVHSTRLIPVKSTQIRQRIERPIRPSPRPRQKIDRTVRDSPMSKEQIEYNRARGFYDPYARQLIM